MIRFFTVQVELGKITLDQVPIKWRKAVEQALKNKGE